MSTFQYTRRTSAWASAFSIAELIYHSIVRNIRNSHRNALVALVSNIMQALIMVAAFYLMFTLMGLKSTALRGDFLLFIMTGIFYYMTHIKAVSAVLGAEAASSAMMQHAPLNTFISLLAAAIGTIYIQVLSLVVVLFVYHVVSTPFDIDRMAPAFGMLLLAWFTGVAVGVVLYALKPWFPGFVGAFSTIYKRVNMIASGKMFVVNNLPSFMMAMFDWNPLFHIIDQTRGFVFINYFPRHTSIMYPFVLGSIFLVIGMMGEFYTRQKASASWSARR